MIQSSPKRILVVKISDIGDLLLATPALRALRRSFPDARIDVFTTPHAAPILANTGLVDNVILFQIRNYERLRDLAKPAVLREGLRLIGALRSGRYDSMLLFQQFSTRFGALKNAAIALAVGARDRYGLDNGRGWFLNRRVTDRGFGARHQAEYWLDVAALTGARIEAFDRRPTVGISDADRVWAREHLPEGGRYLAVHAGSGALNLARRWDADKMAQAAIAISQRENARIVIVGGKNDGGDQVAAQLPTPPIDVSGKTSLGQLAAVLERCTAYLGADSGVMHIASAIPGLRLITLFGPTNADAWGPFTSDATLIRSQSLCSPCGYVFNSVGLRSGCTARTCMKSISADQVITPAARRSDPVPARNPVRVLGIPIDPLTFAEMIATLAGWIAARGPARMIATANPELVMIARRDALFFTILNRAPIVTADGVGLLWAARYLGRPLPERVTGSDGLPLIAERAAREGWRIYLLGAAPGVAEKAASALMARFPGLQIAGTYSGSPSDAEEDAIVARVNTAQAQILFLAYGSPTQEKWIARNLPRLNVQAVIGVGGAFDFVAGITQRAPDWMRRAGLEWLHRLIRQPWRWKRMLRLPRFVWAVMRHRDRGPFDFVGKGMNQHA